MRKILMPALIFAAAALAFTGCSEKPAEEEDSPVKNNLEESKGDNEFAGKTFSDPAGGTELSFSEKTVTIISSDSASSNIYARNAETGKDGFEFNYSFDSTTEPKTISIQLLSVLTNGVGQTYNEAVKEAYNSVHTAEAEILAAIETQSVSAGTYADAIKTKVSAKAKAYMETQNKILDDYLAAKYNAVIKMEYTVSESGALTLTEIYQDDLTNASAYFCGEDVTLNDYLKLIPFGVEEGEKFYAGVPEIKDDKLTCALADFIFADSDSDSASEAAEKKISEFTESLSSDSETLTKIAAELYLNNGESATLDGIIDEVFASLELEADLSVNKVSNKDVTLTITPVTVPSEITVLVKGTEKEMKYTPVFFNGTAFSPVSE